MLPHLVPKFILKLKISVTSLRVSICTSYMHSYVYTHAFSFPAGRRDSLVSWRKTHHSCLFLLPANHTKAVAAATATSVTMMDRAQEMPFYGLHIFKCKENQKIKSETIFMNPRHETCPRTPYFQQTSNFCSGSTHRVAQPCNAHPECPPQGLPLPAPCGRCSTTLAQQAEIDKALPSSRLSLKSRT